MKMSGRLPLPRRLHDYAQSALQRALYASGTSPDEFMLPAGEAALFEADSVSWQVFKNPVSVFIGGMAAVVLELAHPKVRAGVWEHSRFRTDPLERLRRTGFAAMMTVYGPAGSVRRMIGRINAVHDTIHGLTPGGEPYHASDPELLQWVHATASYGFLASYDRYVHAVSAADQDRFYQEAQVSAALYRAPGVPTSAPGMTRFLDSMQPRLDASPAVEEFLRIMQTAPLLPAPLNAVQPILVRAAIDLVALPVRNRLGLGARWRLRCWESTAVGGMAMLANRMALSQAPAVLSCRRLGLPDDFLYRRQR